MLRNPVKAFIDSLEDVLLKMQAEDEEISDVEIRMFLGEIENLVSFPDTAVVNDAFNRKGFGCSKVCFDSYFDNWIIKFYCCETEVLNEKNVLKLAEKEGFGDIFAKSYYVMLPCTVKGYYKGGYEPEWKREFSGFVLQRKAEILSNIWEQEEEDEIDRYDSDVDAELLDYIDARSSWIQECEDEFGYKRLWDLYEFLMRYGVGDLHDGNVGYLDGKPVIIDWDSYSEGFIEDMEDECEEDDEEMIEFRGRRE